MKYILIVLCLILLMGCAAKLPREQQLVWNKTVDEARTRIYAVDQKTLINAAEQALLSFEDDYEPHHSTDGFVAKRRWYLYFILAAFWGDDYWYVNTKKIEDNKTWIQVKTRHGGDGEAYTYAIGVGAVSAIAKPVEDPLESSFILNPGLYKLFFNRLDFILGSTKDLLFCEDIEINNLGSSYNDKAPLCLMGEDSVPLEANQPPEVMEYYKLLFQYKNSKDQAEIGGREPAKPWE
jgi:hypothetical protein